VRSDYLNKEDVFRSAKQQLDLHIHILVEELGIRKANIEIDLIQHIKEKLYKQEEF
jgi:hypothetical protein